MKQIRKGCISMKGKTCSNCKHLGNKKYCSKFKFRIADINTAKCCNSYDYIQIGTKKKSYNPVYNQNKDNPLKFKNNR